MVKCRCRESDRGPNEVTALCHDPSVGARMMFSMAYTGPPAGLLTGQLKWKFEHGGLGQGCVLQAGESHEGKAWRQFQGRCDHGDFFRSFAHYWFAANRPAG